MRSCRWGQGPPACVLCSADPRKPNTHHPGATLGCLKWSDQKKLQEMCCGVAQSL